MNIHGSKKKPKTKPTKQKKLVPDAGKSLKKRIIKRTTSVRTQASHSKWKNGIEQNPALNVPKGK